MSTQDDTRYLHVLKRKYLYCVKNSGIGVSLMWDMP